MVPQQGPLKGDPYIPLCTLHKLKADTSEPLGEVRDHIKGL